MQRRLRLLLIVLCTCAAFGAAPALAQQQITGTVTDATDGTPIPGANVVVPGTATGAATGSDGTYSLSVPSSADSLRFSFIGYNAQTVAIGGRSTIDVALAPSTQALDEVVVIGYGTQETRDVTGVVQNVTPAEFNKGRVVSTEQLIQGKVAGVQVIDSGEPGGSISLRIRGGTSVNASNEPLYVVDGVPLQVGGGLSAGRNPLNFLNPNDIENVTILKDASATAIYGSRGANGVVIIETKSGAGATQVSYTGSVSTSNVTGEPDILDAQRFRQTVEEQAPEMMDMLGSANTDWRDAVQRSAVGQEHNIGISGSTEDINYRLSLGYLDQEGVVRGSDTERISVALNYNHRLFDDALDIKANLKGSRTDDQFTPDAVLGTATSFAPTQPIRDANSEFGGFFEWDAALAENNPVAELELVTDQGTTFRSVGNIEGNYELPFVDGLSATLNLGYDVAKAEEARFFPSELRAQAENSLGGTIDRVNNTEVSTLLDSYVNYLNLFEEYDSEIDVTVGYSYQDFRGEYPDFTGQGLSTDVLGVSGVPATEEEFLGLNVVESRLISGFARLNYTFKERYLLTLSGRRDGSSRFGPDEQWGTFLSAAFAWRIADEPFMQRVEPVSDLKLRVSWGGNGNQSIPDYRAYSLYEFGGPRAQAQFGDRFVPTVRAGGADPGIKWEETTSYNIGIDYGLFDNRISGAIEYYFKETDDLLFEVDVAAGTNLARRILTNIGTVENEGVEFNINATIFEGAGDGFFWEAGFNASTNANEITRVNASGSGDDGILTGGISGGVGNNIQIIQPGQPVNSFFVYRHRRGPDGNPIYEDVNGDGNINEADLYEDLDDNGVINQSDRAPFENPAPDWIFGHTSRMEYQSFDLSFTVRANLGNHVYNNVASDLGHFSRLRGDAPSNLHESALENGFDDPQYFSDIYVEDASFLRMDNISLGYTFGDIPSVQQLRVFGTVQNVFTITGYDGVDPEVGIVDDNPGIDNNVYPRSRTFTGGVTLQF